jgi:hypothetical protein
MFDDHCVQCALPLRLCGACHGVAGPFDRYCGFCGYELVQGDKRTPVWRLWLLLALVPLAAGIVFGISPLAVKVGPVAKLVAGAQPAPSPTTNVHLTKFVEENLGFNYALPAGWKADDYTLAQTPEPFVMASVADGDRFSAGHLNGELITATPTGPVMSLGRPPLDVSAVDTGNPQAVLAFQVSQLLASPPAGVKYTVVKPVHAITVGHRQGAEVVLKVATGSVTTYYERVYIATGTQPLFRAEAADTASGWEGGDAGQVEAVVQSLTFTR